MLWETGRWTVCDDIGAGECDHSRTTLTLDGRLLCHADGYSAIDCHILIILRWIRDHMSYKRIPFIHRVPILASTLQSEADPATGSASSSLLIILQYGENHSTEDGDVESIV